MANTNQESTVESNSVRNEERNPIFENLIPDQEAPGLKGPVEGSNGISSNVAQKSIPTLSGDAKPAGGNPRPSLVQLGSSLTQPLTTSQPKRFSAVNINKKFLEKNSSVSASSTSQPVAKAGTSTLARPPAQSSISHSRLVTAKLTSASPASSTSAAGWSRPSSVAPPNIIGTHSPSDNSPPPPATSLGTTSSISTVPQPPHINKLIQPQPRAAAIPVGTSQKDGAGSGKPAWGNIRLPFSSKGPDVRGDFPTAAEVASSLRTSKLSEVRETADSAAASKQARMEEADTFRGRHLDPNAHHWDEMEEDDDNFLDGDIEFGDGRQYKIETIDGPLPDSSLTMMDSKSAAEPQTKSGLDGSMPIKDPAPTLPVSKEERFADDIDRRPRGSQEPSKVLYNERSNRLEPYSNSQRPGPPQYSSTRRPWQDPSSSQTESRITREAVSQSHNVQLLQKPGNTDIHHQRRFSNANSGAGNAVGPAFKDKDQLINRDGPPHGSHLTKDGFGQTRRDKESVGERGGQTNMGPPPLPIYAIDGSEGDGESQPSPHPTEVQSSAFTRRDRKSSRDSRFGPTSAESDEPNSAHLPSQSPVLSHTSRISPTTPITPLPSLSASEFDEARKDLMQSAAARAKQRRQQEEEEREKEKERARRKAAELEERIKATEAEKKAAQVKHEEQLLIRQREEEAVAVIEDAIKSVQAPSDSSDSRARIELTIRTSSRKGSSRTSESSKTLLLQQQSTPVTTTLSPTSPATQAESWRSRTSPLLPFSTPQAKQSTPTFVPSSQTALNHVESLVDHREDLEVVDFSDMGKFLGVPDISESERVKESEGDAFITHPSLSRPTASDFFDDSTVQPPTPLIATEKPWRPKVYQTTRGERHSTVQQEVDHDFSQTGNPPSVLDQALPPSTKAPRIPAMTEQHSQTLVLPPQPFAIRSPRNYSSYKEPAMTAFDDTISRIKGVLDEMQAGDSILNDATSDLNPSIKDGHALAAGKLNPPKERWVPPALRHQNLAEALDITSSEPLLSPKPARDGCVVRLPSVSRLLGQVNKRQLYPANKASYQLRMAVLSFDPPVEGMNSQDLSVNEVLFQKPTGGFRGKHKYRVHLPKVRPGPRVNIPAHAFQARSSSGAFGRPTGADELKTWRKPLITKPEPDNGVSNGLATTSRSPPPDTTGSVLSVTSVTVPESFATAKIDGFVHPKSRAPKMPIGSSVAFYRDSHIDTVEEDLKLSVNFIVSSELESMQPSHISIPDKAQPSITITPPNTASLSNKDSSYTTFSLVNGAQEPPNENVPPQTLNKPDKISEETVENIPVTSLTQNAASWARTSLTAPLKESPARGPDPEHLRAVWSQTSNQPGSHGVNSLEGIGDDLTAIPFTLQDVKSEDGETPPPSVSTAPSRMSLHDVTRAFQQVPPSSTSPSHRTPPLAAPPARSANYYNVPPPPTGTMRPGYPYPSPIMSHSPSPGIIYPPMLPGSPTPGRMSVNGPTAMYNQPMWMPMQAQQNHANMMRPYSTQIMSYSPAPPPIYAPQLPTGMQSPHQANGAQANRDRTVPLMSPVMSHVGPAMYGSPVLMHAPVMPVPPPNPSYMVPPSRGQARTDNSQVPIQNSQQLNHVQPHPGYNSIPSSSFTRSTW